MFEDLILLGQITVKSSTALMLAALGELLTERSGVLNLGVEGMIVTGALSGFAVAAWTGSPWLGAGAGMSAGGLLALMHAFFSVSLRQNQVLSGLALTFFGLGLCNFLGRFLLGVKAASFTNLPLPGLQNIPFFGKVFFQQTALSYVAYLSFLAMWILLRRSGPGLAIRAVGHNAAAADASGVSVRRIRYACTVGGGLFAGLAGAYLSLAYTPGWKESMSSGQGWMAIAIVILAGWRPLRVFSGALLFGGLTALQFYFQAIGAELVPTYILRMLPYLLSIATLTLVNGLPCLRTETAPANLGIPFSREI